MTIGLKRDGDGDGGEKTTVRSVPDGSDKNYKSVTVQKCTSTSFFTLCKYSLASGKYVLTMLSREQNRVFSQKFSALQQLLTLLLATRTRSDTEA